MPEWNAMKYELSPLMDTYNNLSVSHVSIRDTTSARMPMISYQFLNSSIFKPSNAVLRSKFVMMAYY